MLTVFDLRRWWKSDHDKEQLEAFNDIKFEPIKGHPNLFVADVSKEEMVLLILLGLDIEQTIATDFATMGLRARILHKSNNEYIIIEIHHGILSDKP